jgi:hypothetical protein
LILITKQETKTFNNKQAKKSKMEFIEEKLSKHENCLSKLLRKLLKQKDETIKQVKNENEELKELLLKQQELIKKLNNENILLAKSVNEVDQNEIVECNKSLKQQLVVSQKQNSILVHKLEESNINVKYLTKKLSKYE